MKRVARGYRMQSAGQEVVKVAVVREIGNTRAARGDLQRTEPAKDEKFRVEQLAIRKLSKWRYRELRCKEQ